VMASLSFALETDSMHPSVERVAVAHSYSRGRRKKTGTK